MTTPVRIGLVINFGLNYCREVLRGIKQYAVGKHDWALLPVPAEPDTVRTLGRLKVAGVLAHAYTPALAAAVAALRRPTVNVSGALIDEPLPRVGVDDGVVGRLVAGHLLDRGARYFGVVGHRRHGYAVRREAGFREVIEARGYPIQAYHERDEVPFNPTGLLWALDPAVRRWVRSLRTPIGVFASSDVWGGQLGEVCHQLGLLVPEDVALVGVDNDDLLCEMARPPLSSVDLPAERIGFVAATLLDRLIAGQPPPAAPVLLPPVGVVARQSSDTLTVPDPEVAAAVRFIRANGHTPIGVEDVLRKLSISRRALERRFRAVLRRSVWEEIHRTHLERATGLLAGTDLLMTEVAARAGFTDLRRLSVAVRRATGFTPTAYRRHMRG